MFEGQRVVVTGAARGIGRAIAGAFATRVAKAIHGLFVCLELARERGRARAYRRSAEALGGVSVPVNKAAVGVPGPLGKVPLSVWREGQKVNGAVLPVDGGMTASFGMAGRPV